MSLLRIRHIPVSAELVGTDLLDFMRLTLDVTSLRFTLTDLRDEYSGVCRWKNYVPIIEWDGDQPEEPGIERIVILYILEIIN
jgi:hypothetical protein